MFGCPRFRNRILHSGKPVLTTMGKPVVKEEQLVAGRRYLPEFQRQEQEMLRVLLKSGKVVFISHHTLQVWRGIFEREGMPFLPTGMYRVVHHGIDTGAFYPAGDSGEARGMAKFCIGTVGALRNPYRLRTYFETSLLLDFDHRLLIVGSMDSDCRREFARALENPTLSSRITYVPWVCADRLAQYYQQMHCLFHPVDHESCSNVVIEALACGVPVVVPAHGAPMEFVLPLGGVAAETKMFMYDSNFCQAMAHGVSRVRDNWEQYSLGAREMAVQKLDIKDRVADYLDFMGLPGFAG